MNEYHFVLSNHPISFNSITVLENSISNKQVLRSHFWEDSAIESDVEEPLLDILVPTWKISHNFNAILKDFYFTLFLSECVTFTSIGWKISNSRITFWFFSDYIKICWMFFAYYCFFCTIGLRSPLSDIFFEGPHDITRYLGFWYDYHTIFTIFYDL